jgi:hypothetical protein
LESTCPARQNRCGVNWCALRSVSQASGAECGGVRLASARQNAPQHTRPALWQRAWRVLVARLRLRRGRQAPHPTTSMLCAGQTRGCGVVGGRPLLQASHPASPGLWYKVILGNSPLPENGGCLRHADRPWRCTGDDCSRRGKQPLAGGCFRLVLGPTA